MAKVYTEEQILEMPKVTPEIASGFLGDFTPQHIREWCKLGLCPFGEAFRREGSNGRMQYHIHRMKLIRYKRGEL